MLLGSFEIIIWILILLYPFVLTFANVSKFFVKTKLSEFALDFFGCFIGLLMVFAICVAIGVTVEDYDTAVYPDELHSPLNSKYGVIVWIIILMGYLGLLILGLFKPEKLSPIVSAVSIGFTLLGIMTGGLIYIQLANLLEFWWAYFFLLLYYINIVLLAVRRIRFHIKEHVRLVNERDTVFRTSFGAWLYKVMSKVSSMTLFCFALVFPIAVIFEILFIICGQGADGFIKAFTMTADWTFSTQIPPPPLDYEGHYLCTVASGGHKKLVKPLRFGIRHGDKIIVNRQLLTANAFEDLIMEKMPKFHKFIRGVYDKYGYPISKHITTPFRADIIYIIMKPLEWLFVFVLYLCDTHPENRIAVQYSEYKK